MTIQPGRIRLEIALRHSPDKVWRILTVPELVAKWWAPNDLVPEVGNQFHFDMGPWGKQACRVLLVEPGRKLSYSFAEGTLNTTVTWSLRPDGDGTILELVHEGFDLDSPMARTAFEGMSNGWPEVLERLVKSMES